MGLTAWLASRWLRRRWPASVPLAFVVAVGGAGTMLALAAAERTSNAYPRYLERADVGDVVINPAVATQEIAAVIRSLPGVERVTMSSLLTVSFDEATPGPRAELAMLDEGRTTFTLASSDGRYADMDRPAVQSGRMATGPAEAVITAETAAAYDMAVGDVVPMSFWQFGVDGGLEDEALERYLAEVVAPIGVEHVTIVGIVTLADEVLPDELYPRQRLILSPDLAGRYDCLPPEPPPGLTLAETFDVLVPDRCAFGQHYFSVSFTDGAAGVKPALDEFVRVAAARNEQLQDIRDLGQVPGDPPQYFLIPTETQQDLDRVDAAVRPTVTALVVLGLALAGVTTALAGLGSWREIQRTRGEQRQWHQLGVAWPLRALVVALPLVAAALVGAIIAVPVAWSLATGPVGVVSKMEPGPGRRVEGTALVALAAMLLAIVIVVALSAALSARRGHATSTGSAGARRRVPFTVHTGTPVVTEGVRAATRRGSSMPALAGAAVAAAAVAAALVFGSSLSALVATPTSYGWPWDAAAMTGGGYGDLDVERARQLLDTDPDVEGWTYLGFLSQVSVDGEPMTAVVAPTGSAAGLTVLEGALPDAGDEVAIGAATADDRGLDVGDTVTIGGFVGERTVRIAGIVVFPTIGPVGSDRVSIGTGVLLPDELFDAEDLEDLREVVSGLAAFVGVELRDGADTPAAVARLQGRLGSLDRFGAPAYTYARPVRPAEIIDAGGARSLSVAVALAFAALAAVGIAVSSWVSVRTRRRELAVYRALGWSAGQIRRTVWAQSIATMVAALLVGVPVGAAIGRAAWRAFADQLGVVPGAVSSMGPALLTVVGGLAIAFLAAQVPANVAAHARPALGLRAE